MSWVYLICGILFEVLGTTLLKISNGFSRPVPTVFVFVCYAVGLTFISFALKKIAIGPAYATWSGIGTILIVSIGMVVFRDPISWPRILAIGVTITGVVMIHLTHP